MAIYRPAWVSLAASLALAPACFAADASAVQVIEPTGSPVTTTCRSYTSQVLINGAPQTLTGQACENPDGSWRMGSNTQPATSPVVVIYPPPSVPQDLPELNPYAEDSVPAWGLPLGFGVVPGWNYLPHRDFRQFRRTHIRSFVHRFGRPAPIFGGGGHH